MSDRIQKKLDQETFNPVFTVFLMLLLRISGLFDGIEDSELEIDEISWQQAMDQAVGADVSSAVAQAMGVDFEPGDPTLGEQLFDDLLRQRRAELERLADEREARGEARWTIGNHSNCHNLPTVSAFNPRRPNDLRRFGELSYEPIHEQADEVHIDLGALGTVAIPVPENAKSLEVDPRTFTIQWTMQDDSVQPMHELRDYMTSLPSRQRGGFFEWGHMSGYCTPSRHPMTGRADPGAYYSVGPEGRYVYNAGAGPLSRHVGPTVVGRRNDGRLVLMGPDGTPYAEGERGEGPSFRPALS